MVREGSAVQGSSIAPETNRASKVVDRVWVQLARRLLKAASSPVNPQLATSYAVDSVDTELAPWCPRTRRSAVPRKPPAVPREVDGTPLRWDCFGGDPQCERAFTMMCRCDGPERMWMSIGGHLRVRSHPSYHAKLRGPPRLSSCDLSPSRVRSEAASYNRNCRVQLTDRADFSVAASPAVEDTEDASEDRSVVFDLQQYAAGRGKIISDRELSDNMKAVIHELRTPPPPLRMPLGDRRDSSFPFGSDANDAIQRSIPLRDLEARVTWVIFHRISGDPSATALISRTWPRSRLGEIPGVARAWRQRLPADVPVVANQEDLEASWTPLASLLSWRPLADGPLAERWWVAVDDGTRAATDDAVEGIRVSWTLSPL